jgi:hypothetical protein
VDEGGGVRASKENAVKAMTALDRLRKVAVVPDDPNYRKLVADFQFIGDFLASAAKRLPREASLEKDSKRVRPSKAKRADA